MRQLRASPFSNIHFAAGYLVVVTQKRKRRGDNLPKGARAEGGDGEPSNQFKGPWGEFTPGERFPRHTPVKRQGRESPNSLSADGGKALQPPARKRKD